MVTGAGLVQAQIVPAIGHRNGDRFPDGRVTRPRVECAADSGTVRPTTLAAISRRSGFDFSGAHRARQGFARSARRVRGLDPPGVLPSGWQLPDRKPSDSMTKKRGHKRSTGSLISGHLGGIRRALLEGEKRPAFLAFLESNVVTHGIYALYDRKGRPVRPENDRHFGGRSQARSGPARGRRPSP